jgi:hypothetical protein
MKRINLTIIAIISLVSVSFAQNLDDALRYSQIFYGGTARFMSMGGAFTALGGDLSTLSQNPAGIGVFRSDEVSITPNVYHIKTTSSFNGISSDYLYNFNLNQAGIVGNFFRKNGESGLLSMNFGYSFNKTNNLHQNIVISGISENSSMADYFTDISNGYYKNELADNVGDAYLAYNTYIIDTLSGYNDRYGTVYSNYGDNPPSVYGQNLKRFITYEGYTGEHALSFGGNYSNKIYFGATFGITSLHYLSHYEHLEATYVNLPSEFSNFNYIFHYENNGTGYSFKLGTIIKPVEFLRIGVAFHAPIWYRIDEYFYDDMTSKFTDGKHYEDSNNPMRYNYALATPYRILTGIAWQIKKYAILSADYEFVDYSKARFSQTGDHYDYSQKNMAIENSLKAANNIRIGGEFRINKFYLRGGYGYYGKAFKAGDINQDQDYNSISFGTGFREQNVYFDFGFTNLSNSQNYMLYDSSVGAPIANLSTNRNMYTGTIGFKFGH